MRDAKTIEAEIAKLKEIKPKVRKMSGFGDNHHDAIDGQLEVLEKRLPERKVWDLHEGTKKDEDDPLSNDAEDDLWFPENVRDAGLEAAHWLYEENEQGAPSEGWASLIQ